MGEDALPDAEFDDDDGSHRAAPIGDVKSEVARVHAHALGI